jgi:hypothetical protein
MLRRAGLLLGLGESVVLDASWGSADRRRTARAVADATSSVVREICCSAPRDVALQRIASRRHGQHVVSDADEAVAVALAHERAPWEEASIVDTTGPLTASLDSAAVVVRPLRTAQQFRRPSMMEPD